jgi:hypothetical protein
MMHRWLLYSAIEQYRHTDVSTEWRSASYAQATGSATATLTSTKVSGTKSSFLKTLCWLKD